MNFKIVHNNINISRLEDSLDFYAKALGLKETRRIAGGGFTIVYLGNDLSEHLLELTRLDDHPQKYDLGDNEIHLALETDDFDGALRRHKDMGCVCYENPAMGVYFIEDPDGYWLEILPSRRPAR
ncbi:MAG: VOC family protein [Peptococcaceae bacterium]|jgi:lactoylglutathione lyase|nr:VOC family protein [Peptococcaceae bacterium]